MKGQRLLMHGIALAFTVWTVAAAADEPVRLAGPQLDAVTAGVGGFAYFFGAGTTAFSGVGGSSAIEGEGNAVYVEQATLPPSGPPSFRRSANASYKGSSKAQARGGTAAATLAVGSGVVLN